MDAKTFEYMNDRVKKFKEIQAKIGDLKAKVERMEKYGFSSVSFRFEGSYSEIPHIEKGLMKETLLKLMKDKIEALEKELEEI